MIGPYFTSLVAFFTALSMGYSQATVEVLVWLDANADGQYEPDNADCNEVGYDEDVFVFIENLTTGFIDQLTHQGDGVYVANNIPAGTGYTILVDMETYYMLTVPHADGSVSDIGDGGSDSDITLDRSPEFSLIDGELKTNIGVGVYRLLSLGGVVWLQADDSDNSYDTGSDVPLPQVEVLLVLSTGVVVREAITDQQGLYFFEEVVPGLYDVVVTASNQNETISAEWQVLPATPSNADDMDSNNAVLDPSSGLVIMPDVQLSSGCEPQSGGFANLTIDAGFYDAGSCSTTPQAAFVNFCEPLDPSTPWIPQPICDLESINGACYSAINGEVILSPGCPSISGSNVHWLSFTAPVGSVEMILEPSNFASVAPGVAPGITAAVFNDCIMSEALACSDPCGVGTVRLTLDDLSQTVPSTAGDVYYLAVSGCGGATFDVSIRWEGQYTPAVQSTPASLTSRPIGSTQAQITTQDTIAIDVVWGGPNANGYAYDWSFTGPGNITVLNTLSNIPYRTTVDQLRLIVDSPGIYDIVLDEAYLPCSTMQGHLETSVVVAPALGADSMQVSGLAYVDLDADGQRGAAEPALSSVAVTVSGNATTVLTDAQGRYSITAPRVDAVATASIGYGQWQSAQLSSPQLPASRTQHTYDIPFVPLAGGRTELIPCVTTGTIRCNVRRKIRPWVINRSSMPASGLLQVQVDAVIQDLTSLDPVDSIVGNVAYYSFTELQPGAVYRPVLEGLLPGPERIGQPFVIELLVIDAASGAVASTSHEQTFRCAYDPNDKQVTPDRDTDDNYILPGEDLSYTIRFQNTGNDTAFHVQLVDQLDTQLDAGTITVDGSSHPVRTTIEDRTLYFDFDGIELVDSLTDPAGSQGYVSFTISPRDQLAEGAIISNGAAIYFDQNPPIYTNTIINTLITTLPCSPSLAEITIISCRNDLSPNVPYDQSGIYVDTFALASGCDSIRTLDLTIIEGHLIDLGTELLCEGSTIKFGGLNIAFDGTYTTTMDAADGCDSTTMLTVVRIPTVETYLSEVILCEGESMMIGNLQIDSTGDYTVILPASSSGCDSIVYISLIVAPTTDESIHRQVCDGASISIEGILYDSSGIYNIQTTDDNGCLALLELNLTIEEPVVTDTTLLICSSDSILIGDTYYVANESLTLGGTSISGCDSTTHIAIQALPSSDPACQPVSTVTPLSISTTIYPNPARDYLTIATAYNGAIYYRLYSMQGQDMVHGTGAEVEISDLEEGIYILMIHSKEGGTPSVHRVVKL